ncbi:ANKL1 protein, partial [Heliornis fulica]|nr:ANKL1 protein [Heliornis fulica]
PDPGGGRQSLSFLTEDGTDDSVSPGTEPLSSTRRSQLEELELGGSCVSGFPQPLASSTLLWAGDELGEGPPRWTLRGRMGHPPRALFPQKFDPRGSPSSPQPRHAQGSSDTGPTVLLVPGDHGHPQDSPSDAQGYPDSGPTVLLVPGDHGHPQDSPSNAQGSPCSTVVEPGNPAMPLSPPSHSTHGPGEHPEDGEQGQAPNEPHSPGTAPSTEPPRPLSDEGLRRRLRALGDDPGRHSPELAAALWTGHIPDCAGDELVLTQQFDRPDRSRHWREGLVKSSFNYLLLDPRTTQNLPLRSHHLSPAECFRTFIKAIFYVGKGTRSRPYCHLAEALSQHRAGTRKGCPKVRRILEIWESGQGVISVHCFQNTVPAEAYTREGCLVEALGLPTITNQRKGNCYGVAASWAAERRRRLGVHMLHRAMRIFLAEGERQLRPDDIQGGR